VSIFSRACPQCAADNLADAIFCSCGYCFDTRQVRSQDDALIHAINEEQNYLDYLGARVIQAEAELEAKSAAQIVTPDNTTLAAEVLLAQQALNTARAELKVQQERLESLNRDRRLLSRRPAPKLPKPDHFPVAAKPVAKPAGTVAVAKPTPPQPVPAAVPVRVAPPAQTPAPQKPVAPPVRPVVSVTPPKSSPRHVPAPERMTEIPGPAFHAAQATKAARAVNTPRPAPSPLSVPTPAHAAKPAVEVRGHSVTVTLPADKPVVLTQDCPNCMAKLAPGVRKCRCGFDLTARFEMPELSLSAADRAALLSNLGLTE
jgi:hypothetical protein